MRRLSGMHTKDSKRMSGSISSEGESMAKGLKYEDDYLDGGPANALVLACLAFGLVVVRRRR